MPSPTPIDPELLDRYLAGAKPEADARVSAWLAQHPAAAAFVAELKTPPSSAPHVDAEWAAVQQRLHQGRLHEGRRPPPAATRGRRARFITLAGLAACVAAIGIVTWRWVQPESHHRSVTSAVPAAVYTAAPGERTTVTLASGARLTLAPATTARVRYAENGTTVELSGEALFDVPHASDRPFTVVAQGVVTRVLGTTFVVRGYDASNVRVAVREGRVSVQSPALTASNAVVLAAQQVASVAEDGIPVVSTARDTAAAFAWTTGRLVLRDMALGQALIELSRWYGRDFRAVDPALLATRVDATFPAQLDLAHLHDFADVVGARVTVGRSVITLSVRAPHPPSSRGQE